MQNPYKPEQINNILNPLVKKWFFAKFKEYSLPQLYGVMEIHSRSNILISAPTGATKTLTAFLSILNELIDSSEKGILEKRLYIEQSQLYLKQMEVYKEYRKDKPHSISESLEIFYSKTNEAKESEFDKKINTIKKIIEEQKSTIEELKKEECVMRCYGEEIYNKYELVNDILIRMKKATKKYNLKEKLINHKIIKCVDEARKCIVIEI